MRWAWCGIFLFVGAGAGALVGLLLAEGSAAYAPYDPTVAQQEAAWRGLLIGVLLVVGIWTWQGRK